jgi:hypothetical protein
LGIEHRGHPVAELASRDGAIHVCVRESAALVYRDGLRDGPANAKHNPGPPSTRVQREDRLGHEEEGRRSERIAYP